MGAQQTGQANIETHETKDMDKQGSGRTNPSPAPNLNTPYASSPPLGPWNQHLNLIKGPSHSCFPLPLCPESYGSPLEQCLWPLPVAIVWAGVVRILLETVHLSNGLSENKCKWQFRCSHLEHFQHPLKPSKWVMNWGSNKPGSSCIERLLC